MNENSYYSSCCCCNLWVEEEDEPEIMDEGFFEVKVK